MSNEEKIKEIAQNTREKIKDFSFYKNPDTGNNALDLTGMREIIEQALKEYGEFIRQQTLDNVESKIGFLRQWLNEDRITDVNKMVDNEQIKYWLGLE